MTSISISSVAQFSDILRKSPIVIADFYADWCGPCKAIAPIFDSLCKQHSSPNRVTFTKINVDNNSDISSRYGVSAMPTFLIFHNSNVIKTLRGADPRALTAEVQNAVKLAGKGGGLGAGGVGGALFKEKGHVLGGESGLGMARGRTSGPVSGGLIYGLVRIVGLYATSLFSLDPYRAAEASTFNVHRVPEAPVIAAAQRTGVKPAQPVKRVGTLADIAS